MGNCISRPRRRSTSYYPEPQKRCSHKASSSTRKKTPSAHISLSTKNENDSTLLSLPVSPAHVEVGSSDLSLPTDSKEDGTTPRKISHSECTNAQNKAAMVDCNESESKQDTNNEPITAKVIVPSKPGKPTATNITHESIQIEWARPEQGTHNVTSYTICYRSAADPQHHWTHFLSAIMGMTDDYYSTHERTLVTQLMEKTTYYFKLRPEYAGGYGLESDISEPIKTKGRISSQPGKPQCSRVNHDSIQLEWTKPEKGAHNIIAYHIFYHSHKDSSNRWIEQEVKGAKEIATVLHLLERTVYSFKVQPECEDGFGLKSDISEPITTKMIIPSKPGKPIATNVTHNSIQIEWSKPERGAHNILSYAMFYRSTSDPPDQWIQHVVKSTVENLTKSELSEYTFYSFKIRPECEVDIGLESDISDPIQTKMIIPSKPGKPTASNVTHNSIQLEWAKPRQGAHNVTSYVIFYRLASDPPDRWIQLRTGAAEEKFTVSRLSENTVYSFKIQLDYEGGVGTESDASDSVKTDRLPLRVILDELWDAKGKWYYIGLCLELSTTDLDTIERDNRHSTDTCFRKMISKWLEQVSGNWQMLIVALGNKTVGHQALADSIEAKFQLHAKIPTCSSIVQSGKRFECPDCGTSLEKHLNTECLSSAFPFLDTNQLTEDEKLNLHVKLIERTRTINNEFKDLVYQMSESFEDLQKVANFIKIRLSISIPSSEVNSACAIIEHLNKHTSFFNYDNVKLVINEFGTDEDKEKIKAYITNFENFCKRSVFEVPEAVFGPPPDRGQMLVFKVTDQIIDSLPRTCDRDSPESHPTVKQSAKTLQISLNDARNIQMNIAKLLRIENVGCLVFLGARKGCIELKFSVPSAIIDKIKEQHDVETLTDLPGFADLEAANIHIMCGPPGKPYAVDVSSNSVNLQWSKPEYQGSHPIQHYRVHYKSLKDQSAKWRIVQSKALVENLEIGRLPQNETPFVFKVQAVNAVGAGILSENSDPIDLMQQPLVEISGDFPSKPGKPKALAITHDSIQLEWTKPERGAESITSYTILYRAQFNDPPNQWTEKRSLSKEESIVVSPLLKNTTYLFQVKPECETGVGLESDVSDPIKTKMTTPSKPGKPRALEVTHDSIKLEWTKPEQGAHNVTSYSILCHSISDPADCWKEYKTVTTEESVLISQLRENTLYYFKIHPQYTDEDGLQGDVSDPISTKIIIPSQPGKPKCVATTHDSIQIEWTKPEQGAHNVIAYHVFYHSHNDSPNRWIDQGVKSAKEVATVSHLLERTVYSFKVQLECKDGFGLESDISEPITTKMITPSKPGKPRAMKVTHDSIELEWTKPEQGAHNVTSYSILCHSISDPADCWKEYKAVTTEENVLISQLRENTLYYFKIHPQCTDGDGLQSDVSDPISTKIIIPSQPGKPKCVATTHDSIQIEWTKPEQGAHNVIAYHVFYHSHNDSPNRWIDQGVKSVKEVAAVSHLLERTVYSFKVQLECKDGFGLESDISEPITTKMIIPSKPGKPIVTNVTHDSIQIEWTKPDQGAHNIISYSIFYRSLSDPPDQWIQHVVKSTVEKSTVSELSEYTFYCFKIRPECEVDIGLESDVSDPIQTKIIIPSKPGKPKVLNVTHDSVQLEWTKPEQGAHNITSYTVFYSSTFSLQWKEYKAVTDEKVTVSQLSENTIFYFKILPNCEAGVGIESEISDPIKTKIIIPSKPSKPKASSINHDSVQLEWRKPQQGAHNITSYTILYQSADEYSNQWIIWKTEGSEERVTVTQLSEKTVYYFKVKPEYREGFGLESDVSEAIITRTIPPSKPGKPEASNITHNSVQVQWTKPKEGAHNITSYIVFYRSISGPTNQWSEYKTEHTEERATVSMLSENTTYCFKIQSVCVGGYGMESDISEPILTLNLEPESELVHVKYITVHDVYVSN